MPYASSAISPGSVFIRGGRIIDPASGRDEIADLLIENGVISNVTSKPSADIYEIGAQGKIVAPGLIDMHVHLREPGGSQKERSEERRVGKSVDLGGRRIIKKKKNGDSDRHGAVDYNAGHVSHDGGAGRGA